VLQEEVNLKLLPLEEVTVQLLGQPQERQEEHCLVRSLLQPWMQPLWPSLCPLLPSFWPLRRSSVFFKVKKEVETTENSATTQID
jgi:hypothetical protein